MPKNKPRLKLKLFEVYNLVEEDVRNGLEYGWRRAYKYSDKPDHTTIWEEQLTAIMGLLAERFDLE